MNFLRKRSLGGRYVPQKEETAMQVDLLLDRRYRCIHLYEMKLATGEFVINKKYAGEFDTKVNVFREQTGTKKTIFPTMITTYGTKQNDYYTGRIQGEVVMGDLFG